MPRLARQVPIPHHASAGSSGSYASAGHELFCFVGDVGLGFHHRWNQGCLRWLVRLSRPSWLERFPCLSLLGRFPSHVILQLAHGASSLLRDRQAVMPQPARPAHQGGTPGETPGGGGTVTPSGSRAPGYPSLHPPVTSIARICTHWTHLNSITLLWALHICPLLCVVRCSSIVCRVVFMSRGCSYSVACPSILYGSLPVPASHLLRWASHREGEQEQT